MRTVELSKAEGPLSRYARRALRDVEPLVIVDKGRAVAAVVPLEDDLETVKISVSPKFIAFLEESRRRCPPGRGISLDEMRRRLGLKRSRRAAAKVS